MRKDKNTTHNHPNKPKQIIQPHGDIRDREYHLSSQSYILPILFLRNGINEKKDNNKCKNLNSSLNKRPKLSLILARFSPIFYRACKKESRRDEEINEKEAIQ